MEHSGHNFDKQVEAVSLFRFGAEKNIPQAQHLLAVMYEYGLGVRKSYADAAEYYRRAAEQGYPESQYNLGLMYAFGRGESLLMYLMLRNSVAII
jgi:TPR repeat protein